MKELVKTESSGFDLAPRNVDEAMKLAGLLSSTQLVPKQYQNNPNETLVAMMMGNEVGLNPMQALQNIAVINGRPSIYGDALLALVQNHPSFESINESFDDSTMTATCVVKRKGGSTHTATFSQQDAATAGLWGKTGPWKQYPKRMLTMRARGFALRNLFADALCGLISVEEAQDMPMDAELKQMGNVVIHEEKPSEESKFYSDDEFKTNFPAWEKAIKSGKKKKADLITMIEAKAPLTDKQKEKIKALEEPEQQ